MGLPLSAINRFLERLHADAAVRIDEPLTLLADRDVALDGALHGIHHPVLVEARAGDLGLADVLVPRAAEQQLVALTAFAIDAQDADVARVVVSAGVDAAGNLDLQLAQVLLALLVGETLGKLLRDRDRAGIGEA